jgi:hypothetical protein
VVEWLDGDDAVEVPVVGLPEVLLRQPVDDLPGGVAVVEPERQTVGVG